MKKIPPLDLQNSPQAPNLGLKRNNLIPSLSPISKTAILTRRLPAVTFVAERLKVVLVPHEERVPLVRPDVVDVGSQSDDSVLLTLNAERMRGENSSSKALPSVAITTSGRRPCSLSPAPISISRELRLTSLACGLVSFAILGAKRDRLAAAWILADSKKGHKESEHIKKRLIEPAEQAFRQSRQVRKRPAVAELVPAASVRRPLSLRRKWHCQP